MSIWRALFGQAAQRTASAAARKAAEKAQEPETRAQAKAAARQATEQAKRSYRELRGSDNPSRAAGKAVGSVFVKLKQGVDKGFDAPPRDWGSSDEDESEGGPKKK